jgi:hypothetical protein
MPAVSFSVEKPPQIPPISPAPRPHTVRHPDKCPKLENDAICGLSSRTASSCAQVERVSLLVSFR